MPGDEVPLGVRPVTRSELVRDLRTLGVHPGVLMVHTRMSAIGWVVGGADVVVMALLDAIGFDGTLMAYVGWDENPWQLDSWPEEWQQAYLDDLPPFDPDVMQADREVGRIPERIRTWPGARRSNHPEASMVAIAITAAVDREHVQPSAVRDAPVVCANAARATKMTQSEYDPCRINTLGTTASC